MVPEFNGQQVEAFNNANRVMAEIAEAIPGIEPVTVADIDLFNRYFEEEHRKGRKTHGNGYSYMLQMMNRVGTEGQPKLGFRYHDGSNLLPIVTYPSKVDPQNLAIYFLRPVGNEPMQVVDDLSRQLRDGGFEQPIYVKKIFPDQAQYLLARGFSPIDERPWHPLSLKEDDTFPEQIFDVQETLRLLRADSRGTTLKNILRNRRKLDKDHEVSINGGGFEEAAWELTQQHFNMNVAGTSSVANLSSPFDYVNMIFHNPNRPGLSKQIICIDGKPAGYYITEAVPGSDTTNFYALITDRSFRGVGDYAMLHIFESCTTPFINTGGSEYERGMRDFIGKYKPTGENRMEWVVSLD